MRLRALGPSDFRRVRWKNGRGWTTELAVHPPQAEATGTFDWRVSIAEIEADGAFSAFPGCDRYIALLEGIGMELRFDAAPAVRLDQRLRFVRFAGEWHTEGVLLSGPVRDFNVIVRRDACSAEVLHRPLVGPMVFFADAATWFVYLAAGRAEAKAGTQTRALTAGDALLLAPDAAGERVVLDGGGELVLVKFVPRGEERAEG
jgi:environmental stress-induced protein Ves